MRFIWYFIRSELFSILFIQPVKLSISYLEWKYANFHLAYCTSSMMTILPLLLSSYLSSLNSYVVFYAGSDVLFIPVNIEVVDNILFI